MITIAVIFTSHASCPWCDEWSAKVSTETADMKLRTDLLRQRYREHLKVCANNNKGFFIKGEHHDREN